MTAVVGPAVLALGSNLPSAAGDPFATLCSAVEHLARELWVSAVSPVYETDPVGGPHGQPAYLNAVVLVATQLSAHALLDVALRVEAAHGRVREVRWGPRTLDIDVLDHPDSPVDDAVLTLPHPRAHERAFVLAPWADLDPTAPVGDRGTVAELLTRADRSGLRRRDDLRLPVPGGPL